MNPRPRPTHFLTAPGTTRAFPAIAIALLAGLQLLTVPFAHGAASQPLFETDEELVIRIEAPWNALSRQKEEDPPWLDGKLTLLGEPGGDQIFDLKVKARGNFRRLSGSCEFTGYWINFKKSQVKGTVFKNQDKLKVVAHCRERRSFYERYLPREFLAYKTYNLITDASFRVRLIQVEYIDTENRRKKPDIRPAFLIEDADRVAERIDGKILKDRVVLPERFDPIALNRADFLQFLIGNTDFNYFSGADGCCHNAKAAALKDGSGAVIPLPYDFDLSGIVNPPYAKPSPQLKIKRVTDRLYRGVATAPEVFYGTIENYLSHRENILNLWRNTTLLNERDRKESVQYLEEFFAILQDPKEVEKKVIPAVRNPDAVTRSLEKILQDASKPDHE